MANDKTSNPIFIDTADATGTATSTDKSHIIGIAVKASTDNWAVVLKNQESDDNPFFDQGQEASEQWKYFPIEVPITGIFVATLTNITHVLLYKKASF